jgi:hypothetical protein
MATKSRLYATTAALVAFLGVVPFAHANDIQMFPPIVEGSTDFTCPPMPGVRAPLTWDGQSNVTCAKGVTISGGMVGIGVTDPQAPLTVFAPNTGVTQSDVGGPIFIAEDGLGRRAIEVDGNLDGTPFPDNVPSVLLVKHQSGTGRSITTTGSIAVGGGLAGHPADSNFGGADSYIYGNLGLNLMNPQAALDIYGPGTGLGQSSMGVPAWVASGAGALIFRVQDGLGRASIAAFGNIDGTPFPDAVGSALLVRDQSGTGRSITTTGSIAVGGGLQPNGSHIANSYILASLGVGLTNPSYVLDVLGQARFTGGYTTSDRRLKTDIVDIGYGLDDVMKLHPVFFDWKKPAKGEEGRRVGFIAQEVRQVIPEVVSVAPDTMKTEAVEYGNIAPVLVKAIQQLKADDDKLKADNDSLHAEFEAYKTAHP